MSEILYEKLDAQAIVRDLGLSEVVQLTPVQGGSDVAIWHVECADAAYALRVFPIGEDDAYAREAAVMKVLAAGDVAVPTVHVTASWHDHPVLLLSWLAGRTLAAELFARPWRAWRLGREFGRTQAAIHALQAPAILLQESEDSWINWNGPREPWLGQRLHALPHRSDRLLHLDYHPLNVMTDGKVITGVIDWANAHAGDPRADVARALSILRVDNGPPSLVKSVGLRIFEYGWRHGYQEVAALGDDLSLFYT